MKYRKSISIKNIQCTKSILLAHLISFNTEKVYRKVQKKVCFESIKKYVSKV